MLCKALRTLRQPMPHLRCEIIISPDASAGRYGRNESQLGGLHLRHDRQWTAFVVGKAGHPRFRSVIMTVDHARRVREDDTAFQQGLMRDAKLPYPVSFGRSDLVSRIWSAGQTIKIGENTVEIDGGAAVAGAATAVVTGAPSTRPMTVWSSLCSIGLDT